MRIRASASARASPRRHLVTSRTAVKAPGVVSPSRPRRGLARLLRPAWIPILRRTKPLSGVWGWDRGAPVDRYYIEKFLDQHRRHIRGHVLEVGDSRYTGHFGSGVVSSDVLDISAANPQATIVADLALTDALPESAFDCFILVQTLQYVFDLEAAVREIHRTLKPGGVLLCTLPSVTRIGSRYLANDFWRFTPASARGLFRDVFGAAIEVTSVGNLLACTAFLAGLAAEEVSETKLRVSDPYFPLLVTVSARKSSGPEAV